MVKPIPDGYNTLTPYFIFKDVQKAIDFYKQAFGAVETTVMPGLDGQGVMHAELKIGDSNIMLGMECPDHDSKSAEEIGDSPIGMYLYVEDADVAFQKAIDAGAESKMPVTEMFWGDKMGTVQDPFGYTWSIATHTKDLTSQEIVEGAAAAYKNAEV